jgi:putative RNA 2'-phosphotransferase
LSKAQQFKTKGLARIIYYVLGIRPDEFCLLPDRDGFVNIKELLQALHEDADTAYVREAHLREVCWGHDKEMFELEGSRMRARERRWEFSDVPMDAVSRILYTAVRKRAHAFTMEKGVFSSGERFVVLSQDREAALRMGRRRDSDPVVIEVMAEAGRKKGIAFFGFGSLTLSREILPEFIAGPPVPMDQMEKARAAKDDVKRQEQRAAQSQKQAGSFLLDLERDPDPARKIKGRKQKGWKEEARRFRRDKGI